MHHPRDLLILIALWLLIFSSSSQFLIIAPILPEINEQLKVPKDLGGTLVTIYAITLGIFALITGPISDKIGRRKILLIGSGIMALSLALHALAFDYLSLLFVRAVTGVAGGILTGSCVAYIGDYFPAHKRGNANGIIVTGSAAGQIIGIPIGTLMADSVAFYIPFLWFSFTMVIAFILVYYFVPQPAVQRTTEKIRLSSTFTEYSDMLREKKISSMALAYFLMFFSLTIYIVYFPTWLENSFCATKKDIAALFFFGGVATIIGGPVAGNLSDRFGRKAIILIASAGLSLLLLITSLPEFYCSQNIFLLFFLIMLMVAGRMVPFQAMASEMVECDRRGKFMCLSIAIGQIGMGTGAAFSGIIYTSYSFMSNSLIAVGGVVSMALVVWFMVPETRIKETVTIQPL